MVTVLPFMVNLYNLEARILGGGIFYWTVASLG